MAGEPTGEAILSIHVATDGAVDAAHPLSRLGPMDGRHPIDRTHPRPGQSPAQWGGAEGIVSPGFVAQGPRS